MWTRLRYWLWPGAGLDRLEIVVYTRHGCHLCEEAEQLLRREQRQYRFRLEILDVDRRPELAEQFGDSVPVVIVDGKVRFRGVVNPVLLRRLLDAEVSRR